MICKKCGKVIPDDSDYCSFCGDNISSYRLLSAQNTIDSDGKGSDLETSPIGAEKHAEEFGGVSSKYIIVIICLAAFLFALLIGLIFYQYYSYRNSLEVREGQFLELDEEKTNLQIENSQLKDELVKKDEEIDAVRKERDKANTEKSNALADKKKYDAIKTWIKSYGNGYNSHSFYFADSNIIAVNVGETATLNVTYTGNKHIWFNTMNNNCSIEWGNWSGYKIPARITGVREGITEISFELGDKNASDGIKYFRVLVIVV